MGMAYVARDKTISLEPIIEYFEAIEKFIADTKQIEADEAKANEQLQFSYQKWTHTNVFSSLNYSLARVDGASVDYKSINDFKTTLIHQPSSIRRISANLRVNYSTLENGKYGERDRTTTIYLLAKPDGFKLEYDIYPEEKDFEQATNDFVAKIDQMPIKLDRIAKAKDLIIMKVGFGMGMIPATILTFASIFVPPLREFYKNYFWAYPLINLAVGFIFGVFLGGIKLNSSYSQLIPTKYGGWDRRTHSSYRVDDMDTFSEEVDVLLGDKANIGSIRQYIEKTEKTISRLIVPELIAVAVFSLVALIIISIGGN